MNRPRTCVRANRGAHGMELLKASTRGTASSASGVLVGASAAGTDERSSGREQAPTASRQKRGEEDESVHASTLACLRARKTPGPRVLSRLLQLNAQRQHPSFPTTASAAAAVLLAFATAPIRAGPVPAAGLSTPASASASPSRPASPTGETGSPCGATVASRSVSPASSVNGASPAAAAAARFAAAAAALASDSAVEPGLGRPSTIEEETQQQLLEEDGAEATATLHLGDAAAAADLTATVTAALRAGQHACGRMLHRTLASQPGEDATYEDRDGAATMRATTVTKQPKVAVTGEEARECHLEAAGEVQSAKGAEPRDDEATSEHASFSAEFVESCVVPWKPTCLTEISFDYSVSSTKGDGAAASLSPYESQRSTTSEPAENCPADRGGGALTMASANTVCSSLWNRWPSGSVESTQCGAVSVRCASAIRTQHRRQGSIASDSDSAGTAAATEGMPSNVSRWRLGRATPLRQQKQHVEQPEMMHPQQVYGWRLQQQHNCGNGGHELPLQQLEAALREHQQEERSQNVLRQRGQHVVRRPPEQHLKKQVEQQDKQPRGHDEQPMKTQTLLHAEHTGDLFLQRRRQQRKSKEILQQQQLEQPQLEHPPQSHQQQTQAQQPVQSEHFQDAADFFNLVVEQLQQQQQGGKQLREFFCEQQRNPERHSHEQKELQQHHSGKTGVLFQKHQLPLHDQRVEGVLQSHLPKCAELRFEGSSTVATPAETPAAPVSHVARIAVTARGTPVAGLVTPATAPPPETARALPTAVAAGDILAAAAAAALATEEGPEKEAAAPCRQRYVQPRPPRKKRKNKGGCFVQTSSSGYPGVSWNRRMGAWLAFFYDTQSRRSRTFHPRYFNGDIEATRIAAIEFKKSVDRLFSCAPKNEDQPYIVSLQRQHEQDQQQERQPREEQDKGEQMQEEREQDERLKEGKEQQEQPPEKEERKENPQQQHILDLDLNRPAQRVSGWTTSLLPRKGLNSQPVEEHEHEEQRKRGGPGGEDKERNGSCSSRPPIVSQDVSVGEGDDALETATVGRKRGREDDVQQTGGAANVGCVVSPCLALPRFISVTDVASALLPPTTALNELGVLGRDADASCRSNAAATEEPSVAAVAPVAGAATVHADVSDATARSVRVRSDRDRGQRTAAPPLQAPLVGATLTATAASSPVGVDLSVLAAMGSQERLQKVLTFETDLPGTSAHRLAFSWSRLSTLSAENLNGFYRSRSSLQLLTQGPGAACPTAGGAAGTATEEAGREGCKAAASTIHQLLRQAQSEEEEKEDEQNFNMPSLLQQLQLNEGAAAASISSSEMHLDDALLREGEEELHRILERSYGLLSFPFLWRRELRVSDSKEACPEATPRSRLHDENSSTSRKDTSACSSSTSGTDSITDRAARSSSKDCGTSSGDRSNSTDGTSCSMSGISTNGNSSNRGTESNQAIPSLKSVEGYTETVEHNAQCSSMEKIRRLSVEVGKEHAGVEAHAKYDRGSSSPFLPREPSITGEDFFANTSSENLLKQAVDAIQLNWRKSRVGGGTGIATVSRKRRSSSTNCRTTQEEVL